MEIEEGKLRIFVGDIFVWRYLDGQVVFRRFAGKGNSEDNLLIFEEIPSGVKREIRASEFMRGMNVPLPWNQAKIEPATAQEIAKLALDGDL